MTTVYSDIAQMLVGMATRPDSDPPKGHLGYQDDDGNYQIADEDDRNRAYVRVNLNGAETVISALNYAPLLPDYPVILFRRGRDYYALPDHDRLLDYFEETGLPINSVQAHSHEPEYGLMDFVSSIRLRPGVIYVESGMTISIASKPYIKLDGTPGMSTPTTIDLSTHTPATASTQRWVVVTIDRATGTPTATDGGEKLITETLTTAEAYALVPTTHDPLFAVRVEYNDSGLTYQDFLDLRLWASRFSLKNKVDATTAPTQDDDGDDGYVVGSRWFDVTNKKEYVCLDNAVAAAIWKETTATGSGGAGAIAVTSQTVQVRRLIYREELAAPGVFDVDLTVIAGALDFDDVELKTKLRSTSSAAPDTAYIYFNNDLTLANYFRQHSGAANGAATVSEAASQPTLGSFPGSTAAADEFGYAYTNIPNYRGSHYKYAITNGNVIYYAASSALYYDVLMRWASTDAISRIRVAPDGGTDNWDTGSVLEIWGLKEVSVVTGVDGSVQITVENEDGTVSVTPLSTLIFEGATVTDNGDGIVTITITGGGGGSVTDVTASAPLQSSGGATPNISFADQAANTVLAGPTSAPDAAPTFRALVAADLPAHDHSDAAQGGQITDSALAAPVGIAKGGTGQTTQTAAFDALSPLTTKGDLITRDGSNNIRLPIGANNRVLVADSAQTSGMIWSDALLALTKVTSGAFGGQVRNESGATANEGDVGYLDYDTNYGMVYKTTMTAGFDPSRVCVVLTGGGSGDTIYVTQKAANVGVNYTGTAPAAGEFLITSFSAGLASRLATMHPRIFAVCLSAGSSGTVAAMLLTRTQRVTFDPSDDVLRVENHSNTAFTSTISGAPSPTSVTYGAITSGAENVIAPSANTQLGKMRLWNTTRNSYRLIRSVNTATNTITTVSSIDTWANGDSITILSQTTSAGTAADYIEVDLSQTTEIPLLARSLDLQAIARDTGAGSMVLSFHPYQTYFSSKVVNTFTPSANVFTGQVFPADLYDRVFTFRSAASGAGTKTSAFKVMAYNIACP